MESMFSNRVFSSATFERLRGGNVSRNVKEQMSSAIILRGAGELTWKRCLAGSPLPALLCGPACDFYRPACIPLKQRQRYSICNSFGDESSVGEGDGQTDGHVVYGSDFMDARIPGVPQRTERRSYPGNRIREDGRNGSHEASWRGNPSGSQNSNSPRSRSRPNSTGDTPQWTRKQADHDSLSSSRGERTTYSAGRWTAGDRPNERPEKQQPYRQQPKQQKYGLRRLLYSTPTGRLDDSRAFSDWPDEDMGEGYGEVIGNSLGEEIDRSWVPGGNHSSLNRSGPVNDGGYGRRSMSGSGNRSSNNSGNSSRGSSSSSRFMNDSKVMGIFANENLAGGKQGSRSLSSLSRGQEAFAGAGTVAGRCGGSDYYSIEDDGSDSLTDDWSELDAQLDRQPSKPYIFLSNDSTPPSTEIAASSNGPSSAGRSVSGSGSLAGNAQRRRDGSMAEVTGRYAEQVRRTTQQRSDSQADNHTGRSPSAKAHNNPRAAMRGDRSAVTGTDDVTESDSNEVGSATASEGEGRRQRPNWLGLSGRKKSMSDEDKIRYDSALPPAGDPDTAPLVDPPFEFQFSYTETPKVAPIGHRSGSEFSPFGPQSMDRPWTGRAPLKKSKKKAMARALRPEFDSFVPPARKRGAKGVQAPGPFPAGQGPKYTRSREEILGDALSGEEVEEMVLDCNKGRRQVNLGRDGLTHNMLELIHTHWKRRRVCKVKCKGVPTVDMDNVCRVIEEKTGGVIVKRQGGTLHLFRGRNYNYKLRPKLPIMLWKPPSPIYPKLIEDAPAGLTLLQASQLRRIGRKIRPVVKLSKNGVYHRLVDVVREAFKEADLVKVDCKGLNPSDYKKIGAKLKDLVPCVLLSFEKEQVLMWQPPPGFPGNEPSSDSGESQLSTPLAAADRAQEAGGSVVDASLSAGIVTAFAGAGAAVGDDGGGSAGTAAATTASSATDSFSTTLADPNSDIARGLVSVIADEGEEEVSVQRTADGMMLVGGEDGDEEEEWEEGNYRDKGEESEEGEERGKGVEEVEEEERGRWHEGESWKSEVKNTWEGVNEGNVGNGYSGDLGTTTSSSGVPKHSETDGIQQSLKEYQDGSRESESKSTSTAFIRTTGKDGGKDRGESELTNAGRGEGKRGEDVLDSLWQRGMQEGVIVPLDGE